MRSPSDRWLHLYLPLLLADIAFAEEEGADPNYGDSDCDYDYHYYPSPMRLEPSLRLRRSCADRTRRTCTSTRPGIRPRRHTTSSRRIGTLLITITRIPILDRLLIGGRCTLADSRRTDTYYASSAGVEEGFESWIGAETGGRSGGYVWGCAGALYIK